MSGQFKDERCAACGHAKHWHEAVLPGFYRSCDLCPPEKRCQRFIPRPDGDEKREGEG